MKRHFIPGKYQRAEMRVTEITSQLDSLIDDDLSEYIGRLWFWSFTFRKPKPSDHATKFRVNTHRYIPKHKIIDRIESTFIDGCKVKPVLGYDFRHTIDVEITDPLTWKEIQILVTQALKDLL